MNENKNYKPVPSHGITVVSDEQTLVTPNGERLCNVSEILTILDHTNRNFIKGELLLVV